VQCVARNAADRQATRGAVLTITDHQRQFEASCAEDLGQLRALPDRRTRPHAGEVAAEPRRSGGLVDRLIGDHIGPLIQRDTVSRASAVQLSSLVGLITFKGGGHPWK
jgi:hypothetical protein